MTSADHLRSVITSLRRSTTNPSVIEVCDALEKTLVGAKPKKDRREYLREAQRRHRAKLKAERLAAEDDDPFS